MTLLSIPRVRFTTVVCRNSYYCVLSSALPRGREGCGRGARLDIERGGGKNVQQNPGIPDIAGLVRGAAAGDRWAWERLIDQYARLIWAITAEFKLVESDAADVAQTTWLRLLEHIDRIEYPDRVGSWLAATARNECLRSWLRARGWSLPTTMRCLPALSPLGPRSTSGFSPTNVIRSFAMLCLACPSAGNGSSSY